MRFIIQVLAFAALSCAGSGPSFAQNYPTKPVRMVVPFPPGGAGDIIGRVLAQKLSEPLGQPVIVDNRAGASGNIGAEAVAKAPGDGHTILMGALASHCINYTLERKVLRYDLERDLTPITIVATVPYVLVVHPSIPAQSVQELVAHAKAKPGYLSYGSSGAGSPQRLAAEMFRLRTGVEMLHVPYKGSAQVITDLVGRQVLVAVELVPTALPHIRGGKLRPLAVTTAQRIPLLPDVPTMAEAGWPTAEVVVWAGVMAPAGTSRVVIRQLERAFVEASLTPETRERLLVFGADPIGAGTKAFAEVLEKDLALWQRVAQASGVKVE
jgi:tripartite-type tricarboxylate transporter receptor subunit TctC